MFYKSILIYNKFVDVVGNNLCEIVVVNNSFVMISNVKKR